jgi:hypothetical protein
MLDGNSSNNSRRWLKAGEVDNIPILVTLSYARFYCSKYAVSRCQSLEALDCYPRVSKKLMCFEYRVLFGDALRNVDVVVVVVIVVVVIVVVVIVSGFFARYNQTRRTMERRCSYYESHAECLPQCLLFTAEECTLGDIGTSGTRETEVQHGDVAGEESPPDLRY